MLHNSSINNDALLGMIKSAAPAPKNRPETAPAPSQGPASRPDARKNFSSAMGEAKQKDEAKTDAEKDAKDLESGKTLPQADDELPDQTGIILSLELKVDMDVEQVDADEAVILATRFVIESLPAGIRQLEADVELTSNGDRVKPELLMKLEDSVRVLKMNAELQMPPGLASLEAAGKMTDVSGRSDLVNLSAVQNPVQELKSLNLARVELAVPMRVGTGDWGESVAGRISLMVNQRISTARIHINPPDLGPIEVRVNLNSDQASVQFLSHSSQVRDALEQSIPRLREMLESAGFSLADSDVSDHPSQDDSDKPRSERGDNFDGDDPAVATTARVSIGLIDHYV